MNKEIKVGIADMKIARREGVLITYALGSCIGISLYDPAIKLAALLHIMLPEAGNMSDMNVFKFADTGIEDLVKDIVRRGGNRGRLVAKIAGGAQMFSFGSKSTMIRVGERNVEATKRKLAQLRIPILAQDTGANYGRTVIFYPETGDFVIRAVGKPEKII